MKEVLRKVKGYPNYKVSNFGRVYSIKRKRFLNGHVLASGRRTVSLTNTETKKTFMVAKLVLLHFKKKELDKTYAININYNILDDRSKNLKWGTRGDVLRMYHTIKNKKRGVYKFNNPSSKKKWRAVLKINNKVSTIGYYKTKKEATMAFITGYYNQYGYMPYR